MESGDSTEDKDACGEDPRLPLKNTKFSELLSEEELYKRVYNTCVMIWAFVLIQLKFYINNFFLCVKITLSCWCTLCSCVAVRSWSGHSEQINTRCDGPRMSDRRHCGSNLFLWLKWVKGYRPPAPPARRKPSRLLGRLKLLSPPFLFHILILSTMRRLSGAFPHFHHLSLRLKQSFI